MATARITVQDIRLLLRRFHHHDLESHQLGRAIMTALRAGTVREALLLLIERAPLDERRSMRAIVRRCDVEGEKTVTVARDLHISARHFFRYRNAALEVLAAHVGALLQRHGTAVAPNEEQVSLASSYSLGRRLWRKRSSTSLAAAMAAYERCLAIDPAYAPAHAGIADVHIVAALYLNAPGRQAFAQARASIARAFELQPDLVEAHVADAEIAFFAERNVARALHTVARILDIAPSNATVHNNAAWYALAQGDFPTALSHIGTLFALDPGGIEPHLLLAMSHVYRGEPEKAVALLANVIALEPDSDLLRYRLGLALVHAGRHDEGRALLARSSGFELLTNAYMGYAEAQSGNRRAALRRLRRLQEPGRRAQGSPYANAVIAAGLGMWSDALDALDAVVRDDDARAAFIGVEPCFRMLRTLPRFERILRELRAFAQAS